MRLQRLLAIFLATVVLGVAACSSDDDGSQATGDGNGLPSEATDPFPVVRPEGGDDGMSFCASDNRISWADATRNAGQKVGIVGPVRSVETPDSGDPYLVLGTTAGNEPPVRVELTQDATDRMPLEPEQTFEDRTVCVVGVPEPVRDYFLVVVNSPSDIAVYPE